MLTRRRKRIVIMIIAKSATHWHHSAGSSAFQFELGCVTKQERNE